MRPSRSNGAKTDAIPSSPLDTRTRNGYPQHMDTREEGRPRFLHEQQAQKRLRLATTRSHEAAPARIWASVAARDAGLSIRQIATAVGLSRSRIHHLLQDAAARDIPIWLTHLRDRDHASAGEADTTPSSCPTAVQVQVAEEVDVLRWCIARLAQLERGEMAAVNLRPDAEDATEFVRFDRARLPRVPARKAAEFGAVARQDPATEPQGPAGSAAPRTRHRQRLAEAGEKPRGRTAKARRDALRPACGLPPYRGDDAEDFRHTRGPNTGGSVQRTGRDGARFCSITPGRPARVAGNLVRKYTLSHTYLLFKGIEHDRGSCSREHPPRLVPTTGTAKPVYFLRAGAHRDQENGSRHLSLTRDGALSI